MPCYDGRVDIATVTALLNEQALSVMAGVDLSIRFLPGCSSIHNGRNQIVQEFLDSSADRLVFVDSDVSWEPGDLLKLASRPQAVVGGAYRFKQDPECYPVEWLERDELWADPETGLIEVGALPGGFVAISRDVFPKLRDHQGERPVRHGSASFHAFYHCPLGGSEDGTFCHEWRAAGGQVWLDPEITLTHTGGRPSFTGRIGDWLKSGNGYVL